jgi:hypothetical protein
MTCVRQCAVQPQHSCKPYTLQTCIVPGAWFQIASRMVLKDSDYDNNSNDIWVKYLDLSTQSLEAVTVHWLGLTFICPCIANIFSEYNQQDVTFLKFIYFCKTLYMFQTVFPSIIRSSKLHIQRQVIVRPLLLPAASLASL